MDIDATWLLLFAGLVLWTISKMLHRRQEKEDLEFWGKVRVKIDALAEEIRQDREERRRERNADNS